MPPVATDNQKPDNGLDVKQLIANKQLDVDHPGPVPPGSYVKPAPPLNTKDLLVDLNLEEYTSKNDEREDFKYMDKARRAANYLAAAMIFLKDNVDMAQPLKKEHIKDRLLGHWGRFGRNSHYHGLGLTITTGTCPAITFIYSHCNHLIKKHDLDMFLVVGMFTNPYSKV